LTQRKYFFVCYFTIFLLLILNFLFFEKNECSILVTARHFVDPNWIKGDWWLSTGIEYESLFNFFAGMLYKISNFSLTFILGRLFVYSLWSYIFAKILIELKISVWLAPFLFYAIQQNQSMGFGEWMIPGFETKSFAYLAVFGSILCLKKERYKCAFLFLGLSISFHVLIGLYLTFAIFCVLIMDKRISDQIHFERNNLLKYIPVVLAGASVGIIAIVKWKLSGANVDAGAVDMGGIIYVTKRVAHHVLFKFRMSILIFSISFITISFVYNKKYSGSFFARMLIGMCYMTLVYFTIGFFVAEFCPVQYMKFYFFRTADVLLPLTTFLLLFSIGSQFYYSHFNSKVIKSILIVLLLFGIYRGTVKCYDGFHKFRDTFTDQQNDAYAWIKNNTKPADVFMVESSNTTFYVNAERPIFVAFKHSPQKEKHIVEWFRRMTILNGGVSPSTGSWELIKSIDKNFVQLSPSYLKYVMKTA
jgi:hypothetical protein